MIDYESIRQLKTLRRAAEGLRYSITHPPYTIVTDYYKDYQTGKGIPKAMIGVEIDEKVIKGREKELENKLGEIEQAIKNIESEIDQVKDLELREILRLYCINEETHEKIGEIMGLERSTISKRLSNFWKRGNS
jgi:DNA-directed RNA polymerase specialized sigma subunit